MELLVVVLSAASIPIAFRSSFSTDEGREGKVRSFALWWT